MNKNLIKNENRHFRKRAIFLNSVVAFRMLKIILLKMEPPVVEFQVLSQITTKPQLLKILLLPILIIQRSKPTLMLTFLNRVFRLDFRFLT